MPLLSDQWNRRLSKVVTTGIGVYFMSVAILKIVSFEEFVQAVKNYDLLPTAVLVHFSILIILIELIGGGALVLNICVTFVSRALAGTLIMFTIAVCFNLIRGTIVDCGCYGSAMSDAIGWRHVLQNVVLCILLFRAVMMVRNK
ncbi:MAG: hypothetical protein F9K22_14225 [Bacteroidetes bacterium]|nr:MAG: hypothetical protein F9K22_14225 [Bacteroidota bacterium]